MKIENNELAQFIGQTKYFQRGENEQEAVNRIAAALSDDELHRRSVKRILSKKSFIPAGRVMAAAGSARRVTAYNCFVSRTIEDSMDGIHLALGDSLETMRMGGGIGYDFSTLRPSGDLIRSLDSHSSGPVGDEHRTAGFMDLFNSGCAVIASAGHRRGAQMGVLRVDHPDIQHFVRAKRQKGRLLYFNVSVGVTDEFINAVLRGDSDFPLRFDGRVYSRIDPRALWDEIMRSTWDHAEPGVLFLDTINRKNNLRYCETIAATNPCGEQPLPPFGACLLGSFNLTSYLSQNERGDWMFDIEQFRFDIPHVVRMMDNVIDRTIYPLTEQKLEAQNKRRMGLGITGLANAAEILGYRYGSPDMLQFTRFILRTLRDNAYLASIELAIEKGAFKLFDRDKYLEEGTFASTLPDYIRNMIHEFGIRNSHLLSIAPTGTISLYAGNVSSGCEPPQFNGVYTRNVYTPDGSIRKFTLADWAYLAHGVYSRTAEDVSVDDHINVLNLCSNYVDSSVSKTCSVGDHITFDEFKDIYLKAWKGGSSGCTTFRPAGFREGIMSKADDSTVSSGDASEGGACYFDEQGNRTCDS